MESSPGIGAAIESILKHPGKSVYEFSQGTHGKKLAISLILLTVLGMIVFGVVVGSFSGGTQYWAAPLKMAGGLLLASLMSLPSLYIFASLSGLNIRFSTVCGLLLAANGLGALLLAGFAPIAWVFSQSTSSVPFMGVLIIAMWGIAMLAGLNFLSKAADSLSPEGNRGFLFLWWVIFLFVCLQMSCALRPIIGTSDALLPEEKKFFIEHWGNQLNGKP
jgi:hypothetical protein